MEEQSKKLVASSVVKFLSELIALDNKTSFNLMKERHDEFIPILGWTQDKNTNHAIENLNTLTLVALEPDLIPEFFKILFRVTSLTSLSMEGVPLNENNCETFCAALANTLPSIQNLSIINSNITSASVMATLCATLEKGVNLINLTLSGNKVDNASAVAISSLLLELSTFENLARLYLSRNALEPATFLPIANQIAKLPQLRRLDISYNELDDTVGINIALQNQRISSLNADGNLLGMGKKESFTSFSTIIAKHHLSFLGLAKNGIINSQFCMLINAIALRTERISLDLAGNLVGDGIETLGHVLAKKEVQLVEISLRANSIPDTALAGFAHSLETCKGILYSIDLSKNNISLLTGSMLLQALVTNNRGISVNLEENPECTGLLREISSMQDKSRIASLEYSRYNLVTLATVGVNNNSIDKFKEFLSELNSSKETPITNLYQFNHSEKSLKELYYAAHYFTRRDYMHYGRILEISFRVLHFIVDEFNAPNVFARFRSWVSLIQATRKKKISITFALITDSNVSQEEIETKESQMHDLISELSYLFDHIEFCPYPLFITSPYQKETFSRLQNEVKRVVDSFPVYLPCIINRDLLPLNGFDKIIRYNEFAKSLTQITDTPGIDIMDASTLIQKMTETGVIYRITDEWVCTAPNWFCKILQIHLRNSTQNASLRSSDTDLHDGTDTICSNTLLSEFPLDDNINTDEFRQVLTELLTRIHIWIPLGDNSFFFPPWIGDSIFDEKNPQNFKLLPGRPFEDLCFLGRRIIAPASECVSPLCWYEIQAQLLQLLGKTKTGWKGFFSRDLVRYSFENSFSFRVYFQMKNGHHQSMRLFEVHVAGETVTGCVILMRTIAALCHSVFTTHGIDRIAGGFQTKVIKEIDVYKWNPGMMNQDLHLYPVPRILELLKKGETQFKDGTSFRSLIPDICEIEQQSKVDFRIEQNEVIVEITIRGLNNLEHKCLPHDDLQVMLVDDLGHTIFGEKCPVPGNIVLVYSCDLGDNSPDDWLLVVTYASKHVLIGNTPIWIAGEIDKEITEDWKRFWKPARDYLPLEFLDCSDYLASRDSYLIEALNEEDDDDNIIRPPRTEEITEEEYLHICVDAVFLAVLAYRKENKDYVSKHIIQRELNKRNFHFLPDIKQKIKVYYFAPPVDISWYKSGKTCFYTFERGGDLYICIRGTKTGADIIADLQYSLVPYNAENQLPGRRTRLINRIKGKASEFEMIHNGFSVYADIIIQHFRQSYSEILSNWGEKRRLFIIGHSLGGGIAQVIARKMLEQKWTGPIIVCTFGSPLIGNTLYCDREEWRAPNLKMFNFANQKDPVTNLLVRSWSVFTTIGVAPKLDFGYPAKNLNVFSCNTSTLDVIDHDDVLEYLKKQVAWKPSHLQKFVVTHTGKIYIANMLKLLDDYHDSTRPTKFRVPS